MKTDYDNNSIARREDWGKALKKTGGDEGKALQLYMGIVQ